MIMRSPPRVDGRRHAYDPRHGLRPEPTSRRRSARSCATSREPRSRRTPRPGTATTRSRSTRCWRWASSGLFGLPFPEEYGGGGADLTTLCVAIEELGRVDQSMAITLEAGVGLGANPIYQFGTEEQRQRWLPDLCAGRALGGFGLTEPDAGSDAGGTRTQGRARRRDRRVGDRRREGVHHQLGHPDHVARHGHRRDAHDRRRPEISTIIVPAGTPGLRGAAAVPEDGLARLGHARPVVRRLPGAGRNLLGERGPGFANFLAILDDGRIAIAALALGVIEGCLEHSRRVRQRAARVRQADRHQPGGRVQVADLAVMADAARALTYERRLAAGRRPPVQEARRPWPSSTPPRPP